MAPIRVVGIDPASGDYQCALLHQGTRQATYRKFSVANTELKQFVEWIDSEQVNIVAMESQGGFCTPLERVLRANGIPFYSFDSYRVARYRQAVMGQNKNNRKDAASVAHYALTLYARDELEQYRRRWFADEVLRPLVRMYEQKQKETTREINRLWRTIHGISGTLFLALRNGWAVQTQESALTQQWVLKLLSKHPGIHRWKSMSVQALAESIGEHRAGVIEHIGRLKDLLGQEPPYSALEMTQIQASASTALALKQAQESIEKQLKRESQNNPAAAKLMGYRGIGPIISAQIVAEVVDIDRFPTNNHLASYCGLARAEDKTGESDNERRRQLYNRRLKHAFFTAARSITVWNQDLHLSGYYRHLRAKGMKQTEAYRRVGRALVRRFYRDLKQVKRKQNGEARHEGNRNTAPERLRESEQPHTSPSTVT